MDINTIKVWINEHAPVLSNVYQNKYVGMAYDRFASLPPKQQRQVIIGSVGGILSLVVLFLLSSYLSLWSHSRQVTNSRHMINLLQQYQKQRRDKGVQILTLEKNNQLAQSGALKQFLMEQGRAGKISPRMIQVEEKVSSENVEDSTKAGSEVQMKQATVKLQKINLSQLTDFLTAVERGQYNLSISSIKIANDDKIRGYMNVELAVVAHLFQAEEDAS